MKNSADSGSLKKKLSRVQKVFILAVSSLIFYTVAGFYMAPVVLKAVLENKLSQVLHRQALIEKIELNPYSLEVNVFGFSLKKQSGREDFIAFDQLHFDLQADSLLEKALILRQISLRGFKLDFSRKKDFSYNFSDLLETESDKNPAGAENTGFLFSLNNIEISGGAVVFADTPKGKTHRVTDLTLSIPTISNLAYDIDTFVQPALSAIVDGSSVSLLGKAKPFVASRQTDFEVKVKDFNIPEILAYIPYQPKATLRSALLDADARLSYQVTEGRAKVSLAGGVNVRNIKVLDDQGNSALAVPLLHVDVAPSDLVAGEFHLAAVKLDHPNLVLTRKADGSLLPFSLFAAGPEPAQEAAQNDSLRLTIDEIALDNATVHFNDEISGPFQTTLDPVRVRLTHFSTLPEKQAEFEVTIRTESEETLALSGNFSLSPLRLEAKTELKGVQLVKYSPYLQPFLIPKLSSGRLDLTGTYHYADTEAGGETQVSGLGLELTDFVMEDTENSTKIIKLPRLAINGAEVDLEKRRIALNEVAADSGEIVLERAATGEFNLAGIIAGSKDESGKQNRPAPGVPESGTDKKPEWLLTLKSAKIDKYVLHLEDKGPATPVHFNLEDLMVELRDFSSATGKTNTFSFGLRLNTTGEIHGSGVFGLNPTILSLALDLQKVEIKPFQPYLAEQANIVFHEGDVSLHGDFDLRQEPGHEAAITFKGGVRINNVTTFDPVVYQNLIKWRELTFDGITFTSQPVSLAIASIACVDMSGKLALDRDGTWNYSSIQKKEAVKTEDATPNKSEEKKVRVQIGSITFKNGKIAFLDRKITPAYSATLAELNGSITGLSSGEESLATLKMTATINQHAPVKIDGSMNPFGRKLKVDIKVDSDNIDLGLMSPYTGKYLGYKTDKGKASLKLNYHVDGSTIKADNHAYLDQFTLGEKVQSPDALDLPLQLAIALLQNRRGEITLDIPVQGDLNDPKFRLGSVISQLIFNLIAKAATSPFSLLGSLIPEGKDLQDVDFEPGSALIGPAQAGKLEKLAAVLYERPGLRMDIIGKVDPGRDGAALAKRKLERLVKGEKINELAGDKPGGDIDPKTITISEEEYPKYLALAFAAALKEEDSKESGEQDAKSGGLSAPEPKKSDTIKASILGWWKTKKQPDREEMEKMLLARIKISDDDLRRLAIKRANQVFDLLLAKGPIEAKRLFLIEPKLSGPQGSDPKEQAMQVQMVIK